MGPKGRKPSEGTKKQTLTTPTQRRRLAACRGVI